jgi:hypothetical protein
MTVEAAVFSGTETQPRAKRRLRDFFGSKSLHEERAPMPVAGASDDVSEGVGCDSSIVHMMLLLR